MDVGDCTQVKGLRETLLRIKKTKEKSPLNIQAPMLYYYKQKREKINPKVSKVTATQTSAHLEP